MESVLQKKHDLYQISCVEKITINEPSLFHEEIIDNFVTNGHVTINYKGEDYLFFYTDGYNNHTYQLVETLLESMNQTNNNIPLTIISKRELTEEMLSFLSLPMSGIVSQQFLMENSSHVLQYLREAKMIFEPAFQIKIVIKNERLKKTNKPIKNFALRDEKVNELLNHNEKQVLQLMIHGYTNKQIAELLFFGHSTVGNYVSRILEKLQVNDRTQAVVTVIRNGWVKSEYL